MAVGLVALVTLGLVSRLRERVVFPLYTLSNLLEALREGDYSLRGSRAQRGDAIGDVVWAVNELSQKDRKSVVKGKSVSVRVDLGGRRIIKKKTHTTHYK